MVFSTIWAGCIAIATWLFRFFGVNVGTGTPSVPVGKPYVDTSEVDTVVWKKGSAFGSVGSELMHSKISHIEACMETRNEHALVCAVRGGVQRDFLGVYNKFLTHAGKNTRGLITEYARLVTVAISEMFRVENSLLQGWPAQKRLETLNDLRNTHGRTALLLSGGASFGANHLGVVKTLWSEGLLPRVISGSSAGSVIASIVCSKTNEELAKLLQVENDDVLESDVGINLKTFDDLAGWRSLVRKVARLVTRGVLLDIEVIKAAMRDNIGDVTFQEAFDKTGRILNITVVPTKSYEKLRLLNYLTAPNVLVWSAVCASCALPGLFEASQLVCKDKQGSIGPYHSVSDMKWSDGSVGYDLPKNRLAEMFNATHFIVSQTNPFILHFIPSSCTSRMNPLSRAISCLKNLLRTEFIHRAEQLSSFGVVPKLMINIITQSYDGDITVVPEVGVADYLKLFSNPSTSELRKAIKKGVAAVRPHMAAIRACCEAELLMDRCAKQLREHIEQTQASQRGQQEEEYTKRSPGQRVPSWVAFHNQ